MKNKKIIILIYFKIKKIKKQVRDSLTILLPRVFGFFFFHYLLPTFPYTTLSASFKKKKKNKIQKIQIFAPL